MANGEGRGAGVAACRGHREFAIVNVIIALEPEC